MQPLLLKRVPLFKGLDDGDLQKIAEQAVTQTHPRNTILVQEGDEPDGMYIIVEGRFKVYLSDDEGKELVMGTMCPGEFFGELSLIDGAPRSATVVTTIKSTVAKIGAAEFERCLHDSPKIGINLLNALVKRLRGLNEQMRDLALLDVYGRVTRTLLRLAHERRGARITDPITQQELANMVGASREMVSRVLNNLKADGYISVSGKQITIEATPPFSE